MIYFREAIEARRHEARETLLQAPFGTRREKEKEKEKASGEATRQQQTLLVEAFAAKKTIAIRLIYLDRSYANEPVVKELGNTDASRTLKCIASEHMDTASYEIVHLVVDGEIIHEEKGDYSLEALFLDEGGDESSKEGGSESSKAAVEVEKDAVKVAHVIVGHRGFSNKITVYCRILGDPQIATRVFPICIDRHAAVLELKERLPLEEALGYPLERLSRAIMVAPICLRNMDEGMRLDHYPTIYSLASDESSRIICVITRPKR